MDSAGTEPKRDFVEELRHLYQEAGQPSTRLLARRVTENGTEVSHTTVHATLAGKTRPRWELAAAIIATLGGNPADLLPLWIEGSSPVQRLESTKLYLVVVDQEVKSLIVADQALALRRAEAIQGVLAELPVIADFRV